MSGRHIDIDVSELQDFFVRVGRAAKGDFRKELELFLEGLGNEFLRIVQDEIECREIMDSRLLLASFEKGGEGNVWKLEESGLALEVGTNVKYAEPINNGHWKNTKGVEMRFVPGDVEVGTDGKVVKFTYNPNAKTGIMLKQGWVMSRPYFDKALRTLDRLYPAYLERRLQEWLAAYFG